MLKCSRRCETVARLKSCCLNFFHFVVFWKRYFSNAIDSCEQFRNCFGISESFRRRLCVLTNWSLCIMSSINRTGFPKRIRSVYVWKYDRFLFIYETIVMSLWLIRFMIILKLHSVQVDNNRWLNSTNILFTSNFLGMGMKIFQYNNKTICIWLR